MALLKTTRRNEIGYTDALIVAAVAAVAGVLAALAGCEPTGETVVDAVLCVALGAVVTWLSASASWWALLAASGIALAGSLAGPVLLSVLGLAAVTAAGWIGATRANQPAIRAGTGALVVQVVLRLELDVAFGVSAVVAALALGLLAVTGYARRQRYVRRRILWSAVGVAALAALATAAMAVTALQHRESFTSGYRSMLDGLEAVQGGDVPAARAALLSAAEDMESARDGFAGPLAQPARLVPAVAQNRSAAVEVLDRAATAATTAADALAVVDLEQLRIVDGRIDTAALAALAPPFAQLESAVHDLQRALIDADSPWIVRPVQERLDTSRQRADQLAPQATVLAAAARQGPALLGADEPRRYFLAFVNPAEARAHSGLMGNWSELTIDDGRLEITRNGRTNELQRTLVDDDVFVAQRPEFYERYGRVGAGDPPEVPVHPDLWANITSSPDTPTVGNVMATLYEANAGYPVDGVFVIDPAGIAALLSATGDITIDGPDGPITLDGGNAEQFLVLDQYEFAEGEREDLLEQVTAATIERLLSSTLPAPQDLVRTLADPVLHGHITAWMRAPDEQRLLALAGMDGALPEIGTGAGRWTGDAFAVLSDNANPNKIDSFLHRSIDYDAVVDAETGAVEATVRVVLRNEAPSRGYESYVIGNRHGLPPGTNRTVLTLLSPHELVDYRVDGEPRIPLRGTELGWATHQLIVELPPEGGTATVEARFSGAVPAGTYELLVRPQPLPNPDSVDITVTEEGTGRTVVRHTDPILRRTVLDAAGPRAWR